MEENIKTPDSGLFSMTSNYWIQCYDQGTSRYDPKTFERGKLPSKSNYLWMLYYLFSYYLLVLFSFLSSQVQKINHSTIMQVGGNCTRVGHLSLGKAFFKFFMFKAVFRKSLEKISSQAVKRPFCQQHRIKDGQ